MKRKDADLIRRSLAAVGITKIDQSKILPLEAFEGGLGLDVEESESARIIKKANPMWESDLATLAKTLKKSKRTVEEESTEETTDEADDSDDDSDASDDDDSDDGDSDDGEPDDEPEVAKKKKPKAPRNVHVTGKSTVRNRPSLVDWITREVANGKSYPDLKKLAMLAGHTELAFVHAARATFAARHEKRLRDRERVISAAPKRRVG